MKERALIVTVELDADRRGSWTLEDEQAELGELVHSSGCEVVGEVAARRHVPVAGTFIGSGKLEEIAKAALDNQAQVVVFSPELSPAQQRNIEVGVVIRSKALADQLVKHFASMVAEGSLKVVFDSAARDKT